MSPLARWSAVQENLSDLSVWMERPFSEQEVKEGLKGLKEDFVSGPDGFSSKFYSKFWDVIRDKVMCVLNEFHASSSLCQNQNSSFIALIPKTQNPQEIHEFCPINLLNILYKLLAKVLARRMEMAMGIMISDSQVAFV